MELESDKTAIGRLRVGRKPHLTGQLGSNPSAKALTDAPAKNSVKDDYFADVLLNTANQLTMSDKQLSFLVMRRLLERYPELCDDVIRFKRKKKSWQPYNLELLPPLRIVHNTPKSVINWDLYLNTIVR